MTGNASLFLALRYLRPQRSFVSVITIVSILGVAVGVLMMIVVRAVMMGFEADFRDSLLRSEPHLLFTTAAETAASDGGKKDWAAIAQQLRGQPEVVSATPFVQGTLYAEGPQGRTGAMMYGLDPKDAAPFLDKLRPNLVAGTLDLAEGTLVINDAAANELGIKVGEEISVYESNAVKVAAQDFRGAMDIRDKEKQRAAFGKISLHSQKFRLAGILRADGVGLTSFAAPLTAAKIFTTSAATAGVALEIKQPYEVDAVAQRLLSGLKDPGSFATKTWTTDNQARLAAMQNEQTMMRLVILVITLVAAFSVMNTTITVTTQKRREIGVLTALGCRERQIISVFVIQAGIVACLGVLLGLLGSFLVLWLRNDVRELIARATGGQVHAIEGVFLAQIPARVEAADVWFAIGISLVLCLVAAFLPAWRAARVDAAVALREG
ncbi:MAG: ABC transporter permease [Verrucomicrobiaceae bacterium]|nr:ABC transporter permease [Verrucomicrobiaceae bacterium]